MENRDSCVFYASWLDAIEAMPDNVRGEALMAILVYALRGETTEKQGAMTKVIMAMVKPQIEANNKRYENGCKGGRPKVEKNQNETKPKPNGNQNETKKNQTITYNDNVNDNVNVKKDNISAPSSFKETDSELFIELPLIDKTHFPIYSKDLEKWSSIYPAVDIEQEFRNMLGWLNSNPKNKKTKTGINRFINNWLSRSQDRARTVSSSVPTKSNDVASNSTPLKTYSENTDIETMDDEEFLAYINGGGR